MLPIRMHYCSCTTLKCWLIIVVLGHKFHVAILFTKYTCAVHLGYMISSAMFTCEAQQWILDLGIPESNGSSKGNFDIYIYPSTKI